MEGKAFRLELLQGVNDRTCPSSRCSAASGSCPSSIAGSPGCQKRCRMDSALIGGDEYLLYFPWEGNKDCVHKSNVTGLDELVLIQQQDADFGAWFCLTLFFERERLELNDCVTAVQTDISSLCSILLVKFSLVKPYCVANLHCKTLETHFIDPISID